MRGLVGREGRGRWFFGLVDSMESRFCLSEGRTAATYTYVLVQQMFDFRMHRVLQAPGFPLGGESAGVIIMHSLCMAHGGA